MKDPLYITSLVCAANAFSLRNTPPAPQPVMQSLNLLEESLWKIYYRMDEIKSFSHVIEHSLDTLLDGSEDKCEVPELEKKRVANDNWNMLFSEEKKVGNEELGQWSLQTGIWDEKYNEDQKSKSNITLLCDTLFMDVQKLVSRREILFHCPAGCFSESDRTAIQGKEKEFTFASTCFYATSTICASAFANGAITERGGSFSIRSLSRQGEKEKKEERREGEKEEKREKSAVGERGERGEGGKGERDGREHNGIKKVDEGEELEEETAKERGDYCYQVFYGRPFGFTTSPITDIRISSKSEAIKFLDDKVESFGWEGILSSVRDLDAPVILYKRGDGDAIANLEFTCNGEASNSFPVSAQNSSEDGKLVYAVSPLYRDVSQENKFAVSALIHRVTRKEEKERKREEKKGEKEREGEEKIEKEDGEKRGNKEQKRGILGKRDMGEGDQEQRDDREKRELEERGEKREERRREEKGNRKHRWLKVLEADKYGPLSLEKSSFQQALEFLENLGSKLISPFQKNLTAKERERREREEALRREGEERRARLDRKREETALLKKHQNMCFMQQRVSAVWFASGDGDTGEINKFDVSRFSCTTKQNQNLTIYVKLEPHFLMPSYPSRSVNCEHTIGDAVRLGEGEGEITWASKIVVFCPANCLHQNTVRNTSPKIVDGFFLYGDKSHLCLSAIHAGVITNRYGGVVSLEKKDISLPGTSSLPSISPLLSSLSSLSLLSSSNSSASPIKTEEGEKEGVESEERVQVRTGGVGSERFYYLEKTRGCDQTPGERERKKSSKAFTSLFSPLENLIKKGDTVSVLYPDNSSSFSFLEIASKKNERDREQDANVCIDPDNCPEKTERQTEAQIGKDAETEEWETDIELERGECEGEECGGEGEKKERMIEAVSSLPLSPSSIIGDIDIAGWLFSDNYRINRVANYSRWIREQLRIYDEKRDAIQRTIIKYSTRQKMSNLAIEAIKNIETRTFADQGIPIKSWKFFFDTSKIMCMLNFIILDAPSLSNGPSKWQLSCEHNANDPSKIASDPQTAANSANVNAKDEKLSANDTNKRASGTKKMGGRVDDRCGLVQNVELRIREGKNLMASMFMLRDTSLLYGRVKILADRRDRRDNKFLMSVVFYYISASQYYVAEWEENRRQELIVRISSVSNPNIVSAFGEETVSPSPVTLSLSSLSSPYPSPPSIINFELELFQKSIVMRVNDRKVLETANPFQSDSSPSFSPLFSSPPRLPVGIASKNSIMSNLSIHQIHIHQQ